MSWLVCGLPVAASMRCDGVRYGADSRNVGVAIRKTVGGTPIFGGAFLSLPRRESRTVVFRRQAMSRAGDYAVDPSRRFRRRCRARRGIARDDPAKSQRACRV